MMDDRLYRINGRVHAVGLASAFFNADQLADDGLTGKERLLIVRVSDDDAGDAPFAMVWAEHVQITIRELPEPPA